MDNTGLSPTVELSKGGGAFAEAQGLVNEIGNNWYLITLTNQDTNTTGDLIYHITAPTAADVGFTDMVVPRAQAGAISIGSTAHFAPTRNSIIEDAYRKVKAVGPGQPLKGYQLSDGITALNYLIRQMDEEGTQVTAYVDGFLLPLSRHQATYAVNDGLPDNLTELSAVTYRRPDGTDSPPLIIMTGDGYAAIPDKQAVGDPTHVVLARHRDIAEQTLTIWPIPSDVGTQSLVTVGGTDYQCIRTHQAQSDNEPGTGANWRLFWDIGGAGGAAWVEGETYTAPKQLRLRYRRPLADFTSANDNPDLPLGQSRILMLRLAADLSVDTGKDLEFETRLRREYADAEGRVFQKSRKETTTDHRHKAEYF